MTHDQAIETYNAIRRKNAEATGVGTVLLDDEPVECIVGFFDCPNPRCNNRHMIPIAVIVDQEMLDRMEPLPSEDDVL